MKKPTFSDQKNAFALNQFEPANSTKRGFRPVVTPGVPLYRWKDLSRGIRSEPRRDIKSQLRKLKYLEDENAKLNYLVVDLNTALGADQPDLRKRH